MYTTYWQLQARPFENCTDSRSYYPSEVHQGALLKLRYVIENQRGAALLAGPSGSGKTLLVNAIKRQIDDRFSPFVHIVFPQMPVPQLLAYLAVELGAISKVTAETTLDESVRKVQQFLVENSRKGAHAVVAVDEAQLLIDSGALETLRLLMNFEGTQPNLTILLIGQPQLLPALERMPGLEARLGVKCLLRPLTLEETASYVTHRLTAAGATREIFTFEALATLHKLTSGNPRRINRLCDLALLIGFAEEQVRINAHQIEAVSNELVAITPE